VTPATRRAPRRDAQRNRERILVAAREVVAEHGVAAKMEEVVARAGVGIGTPCALGPDVLLARDHGAPAPRLPSRRLRRLLGELVRRAQADGDVRADVSASDVVTVLPATARITEGTAETARPYAHRFLALQLDALRPGPEPLPGRPLTERQLELTLDALAHTRRPAPSDA
jgi:hypothetical protein